MRTLIVFTMALISAGCTVPAAYLKNDTGQIATCAGGDWYMGGLIQKTRIKTDQKRCISLHEQQGYKVVNP